MFGLLETLIAIGLKASARYHYGAIAAIVIGIVVYLVFWALREDKEAAEARQKAVESGAAPAPRAEPPRT